MFSRAGVRGGLRPFTHPNRPVIVLVRHTLEQRDKFRVTVKVNPDVDCDSAWLSHAPDNEEVRTKRAGRKG
jgi:hypothetical protein